jgi:hypothetical protein
MVSLAESSIVNISMGDSAKLALAFRPGPRRQRPRSKRNLGGRDAAANSFLVSSRGQPPTIRCG